MTLELAIALIINVSLSADYCHTQVGCFRYTCADFTRDSVLTLREHGYEAYAMLGWYDHTYHAWIGLDINGTHYGIDDMGIIVVPDALHYVRGRRGVVRGLW